MQNVHYFGSSSLEASINFGDQNARHKVLSSKRKSMDNSNAEVLQQGDPVIDLTKKTRRVSNVAKRLPTDHHLGRATDVGSPRVGMVQSAIKAVQPSTPSSILSNAKSQQQQANASCGSQGSPQHVPQMDARSNLVSPNRASTISASSSSAETDCAQTNHHDPQTPPPVKYSVAENCMSGSITSTVRQDNATRPEEGGRANLQQHQRMSLPHVSSSTCPYTLRAHKKPGEPSCATQANVQPKGSGKITKKKANSSKCRLLDFSTAAEEKSSYHVSAVNQLEGVHVSPVEGMRSAMDSCSPCDPSLAENVTARYVNAQDVTHSLDQSACEPALLIPCDTFSFDELFDLDLDSSLMTELEDLTALTVNAADLSHGPNSSATSAGLSAMDSSPRTVLTDIANMVHSDESENITERSLSPLASPSKHRKSTRSGSCNNLDKENSPAVGISSSLQAPA
ncbi:hypothetical protein KP509_05G059500 [Ceratopteris richardii]|nr:hypothetical protein KP509_05G059500 [Ceratopteris richardii]